MPHKPLRFLHLAQRYLPAQGGAEIHLAEICRHLTHVGHHVTVATSDCLHFERFWNADLPIISLTEEWIDGVRVLRFPIEHLPLLPNSYHAVRRLIWWGSRMGVPVAWLWKLVGLTPKMPALYQWLDTTTEPFDLVAGMNIAYENFLFAGQQFARKRDIPFVIYPLTHLGAGDTPGQDPVSSFYTMSHQVQVVTDSDFLVAQTGAERDFYVTKGVNPDKIAVVGPGVTPSQATGGDGDHWRNLYEIDVPIVFAIATLSADKGFVHVIQAVEQLWAEGREVALVLAGQMVAEFAKFWGKMPASTRNRIHFLGKISDQEKRDLLNAGDIFAMPSRVDSFGIAYLEAWLNGKPVISANAWGVNDLVENGVDGMVVEFGHVPQLAQAIAHLLDHPDQARQMGQRGAEKAQTHFWAGKVRKIESIYERLVT